MKTHVFRLSPGKDLKNELKQFAKDNKIKAGLILTAVGCVTKASIRMAGATPENQVIKTFDEDLEVVSLVGTLSEQDSHIHIALSNKDGSTVGGHYQGRMYSWDYYGDCHWCIT